MRRAYLMFGALVLAAQAFASFTGYEPFSSRTEELHAPPRIPQAQPDPVEWQSSRGTSQRSYSSSDTTLFPRSVRDNPGAYRSHYVGGK